MTPNIGTARHRKWDREKDIAEFVCLDCPLPRCDESSLSCPRNKILEKRRAEKREK